MGCDLIGYIVVTPVKVSQARKNKAVKRLKALYALASEIVEKYQADMNIDFDDELKPRRMRPLREAFGEFELIEGDDYEDVLQSIWLLTKDAEGFVYDVVEVFKGGYRSVMLRPFPGNSKKQIVATAIESWGDGFEQDSPGWLIERAYALGIMKDLGVE